MQRRASKVNPVFAKRFVGKLKDLGYWNAAKNEPDVGRFCLENPYLPSYVYRWKKGEVPRAEALLVLAKRLKVEPEWLLGIEKKAVQPIAGGSGNPLARALVEARRRSTSYQTWLRNLWGRLEAGPLRWNAA